MKIEQFSPKLTRINQFFRLIAPTVAYNYVFDIKLIELFQEVTEVNIFHICVLLSATWQYERGDFLANYSHLSTGII